MIDAQLSQLARDVDGRCRLVLLVEDVITTGGAVIAAAAALRELDAIVDTVICATDRSTPATNELATHGIAIRAVLTKGLLDAASRPDLGD
jgi:orotate phosphoribosyltransferase